MPSRKRKKKRKTRTNSVQKVSQQEEWKRQYDEYRGGYHCGSSGIKLVTKYNHWKEIKNKHNSYHTTDYKRSILKKYNQSLLKYRVSLYRLQPECIKRNQFDSPYLIIQHIVYGYTRSKISILLFHKIIPNDIKQIICYYLLPNNFRTNEYDIISKDADEIFYDIQNTQLQISWYKLTIPAVYCWYKSIEFELESKLIGHVGYITKLYTLDDENRVYSSSRDRCMVWKFTGKGFIDYQEMYKGLPFLKSEKDYITQHVFLDGYPYIEIKTDKKHRICCVDMNKRYIISGLFDKSIRLCNIQDASLMDMVYVDNVVENIQFVHTFNRKEQEKKKKMKLKTYILSVGRNGIIISWEIINHKLRKKNILRVGDAYDRKCLIQISVCKTFFKYPLSKVIVAVSINKSIYLYDNNIELFGSLRNDNNIHALNVSPDASLLATGDDSKLVKFWNISEMSVISSPFSCRYKINDLKFHPTRYWIIVANMHRLTIWDLENADYVYEDVISDTKDQELMNGNWNKFLLCDGTLIQKQIKRKLGHKKPRNKTQMRCIDWSIDGHRLYVGCSNGIINVFKLGFD